MAQFLGVIKASDVGALHVRHEGRTHYLPVAIETKHIGRYVWRKSTDEGTLIEIESDAAYAERIRRAQRQQRRSSKGG